MAKVVAPKKEKLAAAEAEYSELMAGLNQKKAELAEVEANLAALNAKLKEMQVSTTGLSCDPRVKASVCCDAHTGPDTLSAVMAKHPTLPGFWSPTPKQSCREVLTWAANHS